MTTAETTLAERMRFASGQSVQELGHDKDCNQELRESVEALTGSALVDANHEGTTDAVLVWYCQGDGDLVDLLVDASAPLAGGGTIWLLTPKTGRSGHVDPADTKEGIVTAGLPAAESIADAPGWHGTRIAVPDSSR
ncbi:DUF3052 domain-containing protein [Streptomyces sp. NPDC086147]|uniref:DUF3052 domain-containing protein n=1 Tax=Streptomyces sp. NPDC086147 TaxID=3155295 RepID=UPI00344BD1C7